MSKRELQYAALGAAAVMLLTWLPYFIVWFFTPMDGVFPLILFNSDDHGVYFAWMRQARDGQLFFRNLFTTEPQRGVYFHLYFLLLGWLSRLPALEIPAAYHLGRTLFGVATLVLAYRLGAFFTRDLLERRAIFWTVALSSGLGWLVWSDRTHPSQPVDVWQPEALTFPSLYVNGLFAVSLALMLGVVLCLLLAETRGARWAVAAGACGLLLGNIHSYDVIHLTAVWATYLGLRGWTERRFPARLLGLALIAALVASPSVLYMAWLYKTEPVFQARADTPTLTPGPLLYLVGYGLLVPLAAWGARLLLRRLRPARPDGEAREAGPEPAERAAGEPDPPAPLAALLPLAWAIAGIAVAYVPVAFQRKMVMGYHFPLAILAGLGLAALARRAAPRLPLRPGALVALGIALLSVSNAAYLVRDVRVAFAEGRTSTGVHPVYWPAGRIRAFEWLGRETPGSAALLTHPLNGVLAPAYSGRAVYAGHWGETPSFSERFAPVLDFYRGVGGSERRRRFLRENGITHVLWSSFERAALEAHAVSGGAPARVGLPLEAEPFLRPVYQDPEGEATLFEVRQP